MSPDEEAKTLAGRMIVGLYDEHSNSASPSRDRTVFYGWNAAMNRKELEFRIYCTDGVSRTS